MAQATGRTSPKAGSKTSSNQTGKTAAKTTTTKMTASAADGTGNGATAGGESAVGSPDGMERTKGDPRGNRVLQSLDTLVDPVARGAVWRGWMDRYGVSRLLQPVGSVMGLGSRGQSATGATGAAGAAGTTRATKPKSGSFKFLLGMMIFIFSAEFLVYLLSFVNNVVFHGALTRLVLGTLPLIGPVSVFFLIYILLTLGLWMALYRLNIIPRDPFGVRAQQAAARGRGTGTGSSSTTATIGRNRAARQATGATKSTANDTSSSRRTVSGPNDAAYQRVKAAQRTRKRRGAKR